MDMTATDFSALRPCDTDEALQTLGASRRILDNDAAIARGHEARIVSAFQALRPLVKCAPERSREATGTLAR
jgi:hypothetical protein